MNSKLKLSPPWVTCVNKIKALFGQDKDIRIESCDSGPGVKLYVGTGCKAAALEALLPDFLTFGDVECAITVVPGNDGSARKFKTDADAIAAAFEGNPVVAVIRPVSKGLFKDLTYVAFKREVVSFFNDDLADINGNWNGLYADIAKELLTGADGVFFCTAAENGFGAPLGEWP